MDNLSILVVLFLFFLHHFISFVNEGGLKNPFNMRLFYMMISSLIICLYLIIIFNGHRWRELLPNMCNGNNGIFVSPGERPFVPPAPTPAPTPQRNDPSKKA